MQYYKQETNYTCGCASMRMVLANLKLPVPEEEEMIKLLDTNDQRGTHPDTLVEYAKGLGLDVLFEEDSTMNRVQELHNSGYVVTLLISVDVPHIIVYGGGDNNHFTALDPYFGISKFRVRKFDSNKQMHPLYRWRIVQKEFAKDFPDHKFYDKDYNKTLIAFKNP